MRRYAYAPGGQWDAPPDTDPAPVECTNCGRLDCDCGDADEPDEWDEGNALPEEGR